MAQFQRQTKYDGRMVYLPNVHDIRSGDILLTRNVESKDLQGLIQSGAIRVATLGRFSHALVCSRSPTFVEAIGTGVSTLSLARCFAHDIANVRVLRYPDYEIARKAGRLALSEIGRDYSFIQAIQSPFPIPILPKIKNHGTFCSALVAQLYMNAGSLIFKKTPVDRTTPETIDSLEELQDITNTVFQEKLALENIEEMSALDGDRVFTLSAAQTEFSNNCAKELSPIAKRIANEFPECDFKDAHTFIGFIQFILNAIAKEGNVPAERRSEYSAKISQFDKELEAFMIEGKYAQILDEIISADDSSMMNLLRQSFESRPNIDLELIRNHVEARSEHLSERRHSMDSLAVAQGRSAALREYLFSEKKAIEAIQLQNVLFEEILRKLGA